MDLYITTETALATEFPLVISDDNDIFEMIVRYVEPEKQKTTNLT
ncbi:hypothetical protein [Chryseobacterium rhizosphaerae]|nr:hypothetical protein [Chryseobacterium rhizosphaerae]